MREPRAFTALVIVLGLCAAFGCEPPDPDPPDTPDPSPDAVRLMVPFVGQQTEVWCWAATCEMVLMYDSKQVRQCDVVSRWTGLPCCSVPLNQCVFAAPSMQFIASTLGFEGVPAQAGFGALSFEQIKSEIDAGNPIIAGYRSSFSGHVVVVYGYDDGFGEQRVFLHDPYFGSYFVPYGQALRYGSNNGIWSETIVTRTNSATRLGWDPLDWDEIDWSRVPEFEDDGRDPDVVETDAVPTAGR